MVRIAAAEMIVSLDASPRFVESEDADLCKGALRAAARQQLALDEGQARSVIQAVPSPQEQDDAILCLVVASAGWSPTVRDELLRRAAGDAWPSSRDADEAAGRNEYVEVTVL